MLRWLFLIFALVVGAASLLTLFKAPNLTTWMVAILAGEYGHWLVVAVVLLAIGSLVAIPPGFLRQTVLLIFFVAGLLFAKPTIQAHFMAEALPKRLEMALGPVVMDHPPLRPAELFGFHGPAPVDVITEVFTGAGTPNELSLDFYRALGLDEKPMPCVIVIHGGGWDRGERAELPDLNHHLARNGYAVASISYRLAPKNRWPAQRDDVLAALAFLKENAASHGIDPTRFVLFGRSAGGNIAEAVGYAANDPAIRGVVAYYAPADLNFAWTYARDDDVLNTVQLLAQYLGGAPKLVPESYEQTSGYQLVDKDTPPTLLVHGGLDALVWHRQSERLGVRLAKNSVPHFFVSLPWATHAFDYNLRGPGGQLATYALEHFLAVVTKEGGAVFPSAKAKTQGLGAETPKDATAAKNAAKKS